MCTNPYSDSILDTDLCQSQDAEPNAKPSQNTGNKSDLFQLILPSLVEDNFFRLAVIDLINGIHYREPDQPQIKREYRHIDIRAQNRPGSKDTEY